MTEYLTLDDVLSLVEDLAVGPVRDVGLIDSAVHRPQVSVFGRDAYPGIDDKAAALVESLVRYHGLADGDKRLGWLCIVVFYGLNDIALKAPDDDAYDLVIAIANGDHQLSSGRRPPGHLALTRRGTGKRLEVPVPAAGRSFLIPGHSATE